MMDVKFYWFYDHLVKQNNIQDLLVNLYEFDELKKLFLLALEEIKVPILIIKQFDEQFETFKERLCFLQGHSRK